MSKLTQRMLPRWAIANLVALGLLLLLWELALAPIRPGGSWLALKAVPLLAPLSGLLAHRRYTFQWTTMLALAYVAEGLARGVSDPAELSRVLAWIEVALAGSLFALAATFCRLTRQHPATIGPS